MIKIDKTPDDTVLLDVKINNLFHKIVHMLQEIKIIGPHMFACSFHVPLIALPVFIIVLLGEFHFW